MSYMRPNLPHPLRDPRQRHRRRERRHGSPAPAHHTRAAGDHASDRVREAGGPLDRAAYNCGCGYQFSAPVSTTVSCPHCGAGQAW